MLKRLSMVLPVCLIALAASSSIAPARAENAAMIERSNSVDELYKDALEHYRLGKYDKAQDGLNRILAVYRDDPGLAEWRGDRDLMPARQDVVRMIDDINAAADQQLQRERTITREQELQRETIRKRQQNEQARKEAEAAAKRLALQKQKAEKRAREEAERNEREAVRRARIEELARQKAERARQQAALEEQRRNEQLARERMMAEQREQAIQKEALLAVEKDMHNKAREAELERERKTALLHDVEAKEASAKVKQAQDEKRLSEARQSAEEQKQQASSAAALAQSSALSDAQAKASRSAKEKHDRETIERIDYLWKEARRLYSAGAYRESIKYFREVIASEGNPRIKYTPEAIKYIQAAEEKAMNEEDARRTASDRREVTRVENDMIAKVDQSQILPYIEPPKKLETAKSGAIIEPSALRKKLNEQRITMDFDKVSLKSVMQFLSQESGVNFVASQKVLNLDPVVTTRFNNTPLFDVTKYITKSLGLTYRIDKDVVWIADPEETTNEPMETRVYYLLKGGGLFADFTPVSGGNTGLGGSSAQINKVYTIEDTLKEAVPWPADAKLTYDKRLNALIVRNTPQNLQMLEDMLYTLDIDPCQILIEAKFIEVDITNQEDLGIEWKIANEDFAVTTKNGGAKTAIAKDSGINFSDFLRPTEGFNLTYKGVLTTPQFEMVLHALEESKKIKTLSSPRITTLNNQLASIKVVDEWIYPTRYEYEIVQFDLNGDGDFADAGETTYKNVPKDFLRRDVGILLKVVPTVGADKQSINLSLIPEVSEAEADAFIYTGDVKLPKFTSRNLATTIVVNNGDTVVLGGLIKENRTHTVTKVPFLSSVPFLGNLFKKDADTVQRKNLIIFVTAKVLSPSGEEIVVK